MSDTAVRWEFFDAWSPELAWWLGLFMGDGCAHAGSNGTYRTHLIGDPTTVVRWANLWLHDYRTYPGGRYNRVISVHNDCKRFLEYLRDRWGFWGPKSNSLVWPADLPTELRCHFLRGFWDADGCVSQDTSTVYAYPIASVSSRSELFIESVRSELISYGVAETSVRRAEKVLEDGSISVQFSLGWSGSSAFPVLDLLYREAPRDIRNERKYSAALECYLWRHLKEAALCSCGSPARKEGKCDPCWYRDAPKRTGSGVRCAVCGIRHVIAKDMCTACYNQKRRGAPQRKRKWGPADIEALSTLQVSVEDQSLLQSVVALYRAKGFPWSELVDIPSEETLQSVRNAVVKYSEGAISSFSSAGRRSCLWAHPQHYSCYRVGLPSLVEAYGDDAWLLKAIKQQAKENADVGPRAVIRCLQWFLTLPTNFSPSLARWVVDTYAPDKGAVLDPCAGFGGRLMGALASARNVSYTGFDVEPRMVAGNQKLAAQLSEESRTHLELRNSVSSSSPWPTSDLVFTCPPYFDLEVYGKASKRLLPKSYAAWVEAFLVPFEAHSRASTKRVALVTGLYSWGGIERDITADVKRIFSQEWSLLAEHPIGRRAGKAPREFLTVWDRLA